MLKRSKNILLILVLSSILIVSIVFNIYLLTKPSTLIGVVDHKKVGEGIDMFGKPINWYTVSLWLATEDNINKIEVGMTIAYTVDENEFDRIEVGDIVKAIPFNDLKMKILDVISKTEPSISIVNSAGSCGDLEKPLLAFERGGQYVFLRYFESAGVPCYRHVIDKSFILERFPLIINLTLKLESTSDTCVECIGVIETLLRVGPVSEGTEIVVNGLRVIV